MKKSLLIAAAVALTIPSLHARTWTSSDGSKTFEGELRSFNESTGEVTVLVNGRATTFKQEMLSEEDRAFLLEAQTAPASSDPSEALAAQKVGSQVLKAKLHRLEGERFKKAELAKAPEYYILYFSASW